MLIRSILAERVEHAWAAGEVANGAGHQIREVLGHDADTLQRYLSARKVLATTPHVSANMFFPRADSHVHAARIAREDDGFQIRAVLTHTTLSDLRWRPYAWWLTSANGDLEKFAIESRNKARKHVTVHACAPTDPQRDAARIPDSYQEAWWLAGSARNLAWSLMILAAMQERLSGVAERGRTLFVPLHWVAGAAASWLSTGGGAADSELLEQLRRRGRALNKATGRLVDVEPGDEPLVFDNATNLTMLGLFTDVVVGGEKMAGYWPDLRADGAPGLDGVITPPSFCLKPAASLAEVYPPSPQLAAQLECAGIPYSLGLAQSLLGAPLI